MDNDMTPTASLPLTGEPTTRSPASAPSPGVWNAESLAAASPAPAQARGRTTTMIWGAFLIAVGAVCLAIGAGLAIDPVMAGIIILAGLGVLLLVAALVPRRRRAPAAKVDAAH